MPGSSEEKDKKQSTQAHASMDPLMRKMGKYALVSVVATRAADIKARQARIPHTEALDNAVTLAIADVAQGRVKVIKKKEAE